MKMENGWAGKIEWTVGVFECGLRSAEYGMEKQKFMGNENLKQRTKTFALNVVKLVERLPGTA